MQKKILIAEKEGIIALDIQIILKKFGYDVPVKTRSIIETFENIIKYNPDLILMNIVFNGQIDGIEAAKKIRTYYNTPIIFITSKCDNYTLNKIYKIRNSEYISKPFRSEELLKKVNLLLQIQKTTDRSAYKLSTKIITSANFEISKQL